MHILVTCPLAAYSGLISPLGNMNAGRGTCRILALLNADQASMIAITSSHKSTVYRM